MGSDDNKDKKPTGDENNNSNNNNHNRRNNRNRNNRNCTMNVNNMPDARTSTVSTYEGKTKEIKDNIFDNTGTQDAALFSDSLIVIADHLHIIHGADLAEAIRMMKPVVITIPSDLPTGYNEYELKR